MNDKVAEWLRRWTANPLCSARMGSNPILVVAIFSFSFIIHFSYFHGLSLNAFPLLSRSIHYVMCSCIDVRVRQIL